MTRAAKVTYFVALLMGLLAGGLVGFQSASLALQSHEDISRITAPFIFGDFSYLQFKHADPKHAEAAVQMFVSFLQEMEKLAPSRRQKVDLALAYTRLALLADAAHNPDQSHTYMANALYWYKAGPGHEYSESEMKAALKTSDEHLH
jgi:hypothetical protein